MNPLERLAVWLNVRPAEVRAVSLSFLGAFLVMSFLILARSLREALYLSAFDIKTLPYITVAVAVLSVPTVGLFGRALAVSSPTAVLRGMLFLLAAGLAVLWPFAASPKLLTHLGFAVVAFYLWTALGSLLLTSGFWVVTSEYFPVRGAKRLFGLIGAGGTAGAMVMGNSLVWLTARVDLDWLVPGLIALIALFYCCQRLLPALDRSPSSEGDKSSITASFLAAWRSPHLRTLSLIVFAVGIATTLLDYQFKEAAQANFLSEQQLTSFFGAFYGWTGGIALVLQLLLVARFLALAGVAWALALLPLVLALGSVGMLIIPSLILVTAVRGADASLRKSIYRSAQEVMFVPVPSVLRRKTKTFIDSVVDAAAEGLGAAIILLLVTLAGFPSHYLSVLIIGLSLVLLLLSRRMGWQYFRTVTAELQRTGEASEVYAERARLEGRDLLSGTFTRLDISSLADELAQPQSAVSEESIEESPAQRREHEADIAERLNSPNLSVAARALEERQDWGEELLPLLCRLLARDGLVERAAAALTSAGARAVPHLTRLLADDSADFVIRRRIPKVLARLGEKESDNALLDALFANRFEIRYRAAIALVRRQRLGTLKSERFKASLIWEAIRAEVGRGRPIWEMQKLLDEDREDDDLVVRRVGARGELSLEHTFRLLSLVLEPEAIRAAFHGVVLDDENLKSFSLEYLEQVLPADVRSRLWPFIGDISEQQRRRSIRPLDDVVSDLMATGATLFGDSVERAALKRILDDQE